MEKKLVNVVIEDNKNNSYVVAFEGKKEKEHPYPSVSLRKALKIIYYCFDDMSICRYGFSNYHHTYILGDFINISNCFNSEGIYKAVYLKDNENDYLSLEIGLLNLYVEDEWGTFNEAINIINDCTHILDVNTEDLSSDFKSLISFISCQHWFCDNSLEPSIIHIGRDEFGFRYYKENGEYKVVEIVTPELHGLLKDETI